VLGDHPHRPITNLRGIPVGCGHGSILSREGASRFPGPIQLRRLDESAETLFKNAGSKPKVNGAIRELKGDAQPLLWPGAVPSLPKGELDQ